MKAAIDKLFVMNRGSYVEILYYCPICESINELSTEQKFDNLICRNCQALLTAQSSPIEIGDPTTDGDP